MHEYNTGLLVELEPDSHIFLSIYTVENESNIERIISRLDETDASGEQLNIAAKRALAALYLIRIPGLHTQMNDGNQEAREIFSLISHVVTGEPSQWNSREIALRSIKRFLRLSQHACLLLGSRLPREYVKHLHMRAVIVGFTDDADEESQALSALVNVINDKPAPISGSFEEPHSFAIKQVCAIIQELIFFTDDVRILIRDILAASTKHFGKSIPPHAMAGMLILTRISQDLEAVKLLTQAERPAQALTLDAVIFELGYLIGYFGSNEVRASRWLPLDRDDRLSHDDGSFPSIKDFIRYTYLNGSPNIEAQELRKKVNQRYKEYKFLCGYKHGHAGDIRRATTSTRSDGILIFTPEPQQDYLETWLSLVGIWKGLYISLTVAVHAFSQFTYQTPNLNERKNTLIDRLLKIDKQLEEIENSTGMNNALRESSI